MSVLPCNRVGCNHIMCDRYSPTYGYICNECFNELVERGINTDVETFMATAPGPVRVSQDSWTYFNEVFPDTIMA